jgi:hypothetical protein
MHGRDVGCFDGAKQAGGYGVTIVHLVSRKGTGKFMRHVKLRPDRDFNAPALTKLIDTAYTDMKERMRAEL